jgi:hypothetical protein
MEMINLLEENPKTATVIKQWLLDRMLESMKDDSVPEEFKQLAREQGIDSERVAGILKGSPRALFDVFDNHKIYLETIIDTGSNFWWKIGENQSPIGYEFRINCDKSAIEEAFKLLEAKI